MNIYRNQYADGNNGWFETSFDAWNNANAQDDPQSLLKTAIEIRITSKSKLIELLRTMENEIKNELPMSMRLR
jgi:hypothetical protein